jgi:flagellar motility protein MotE (MotC chaperone)
MTIPTNTNIDIRPKLHEYRVPIDFSIIKNFAISFIYKAYQRYIETNPSEVDSKVLPYVEIRFLKRARWADVTIVDEEMVSGPVETRMKVKTCKIKKKAERKDKNVIQFAQKQGYDKKTQIKCSNSFDALKDLDSDELPSEKYDIVDVIGTEETVVSVEERKIPLGFVVIDDRTSELLDEVTSLRQEREKVSINLKISEEELKKLTAEIEHKKKDLISINEEIEKGIIGGLDQEDDLGLPLSIEPVFSENKTCLQCNMKNGRIRRLNDQFKALDSYIDRQVMRFEKKVLDQNSILSDLTYLQSNFDPAILDNIINRIKHQLVHYEETSILGDIRNINLELMGKFSQYEKNIRREYDRVIKTFLVYLKRRMKTKELIPEDIKKLNFVTTKSGERMFFFDNKEFEDDSDVSDSLSEDGEYD